MYISEDTWSDLRKPFITAPDVRAHPNTDFSEQSFCWTFHVESPPAGWGLSGAWMHFYNKPFLFIYETNSAILGSACARALCKFTCLPASRSTFHLHASAKWAILRWRLLLQRLPVCFLYTLPVALCLWTCWLLCIIRYSGLVFCSVVCSVARRRRCWLDGASVIRCFNSGSGVTSI